MDADRADPVGGLPFGGRAGERSRSPRRSGVERTPVAVFPMTVELGGPLEQAVAMPTIVDHEGTELGTVF